LLTSATEDFAGQQLDQLLGNMPAPASALGTLERICLFAAGGLAPIAGQPDVGGPPNRAIACIRFVAPSFL